jgi:hypothetical protein
MYDLKTVAKLRLLAVLLVGLPSSVNAQSVGRPAQVSGASSVGMAKSASAFSSSNSSSSGDTYVPIHVDSLVNNSSLNINPEVANSNSANFTANIGNTGDISVQTNIDDSKSVSAASNLSVTETINGTNIAYGLNGANVLNVIDNSAANVPSTVGPDVSAIDNVVNEALWVSQQGN